MWRRDTFPSAKDMKFSTKRKASCVPNVVQGPREGWTDNRRSAGCRSNGQSRHHPTFWPNTVEWDWQWLIVTSYTVNTTEGCRRKTSEVRKNTWDSHPDACQKENGHFKTWTHFSVGIVQCTVFGQRNIILTWKTFVINSINYQLDVTITIY